MSSNGDMPAMPGEGSPYFESNDGQKRLCSEYGIPIEPYTGLTKRELFAAMAMQGLIVGIDSPAQEACARLAVGAADYLLAELAKKGGGE